MTYELPKTIIEFKEINNVLIVTDLTSKKSIQFINQKCPIGKSDIEFFLWGFFGIYPEIEMF